MKRAILMNRDDTVATALQKLATNEVVSVVLPSQALVDEITVKEAIPFGHKLAVQFVRKGEQIIKYGEVVGKASRNIDVGEHVHVHNVRSNRMQLPELWYRR